MIRKRQSTLLLTLLAILTSPAHAADNPDDNSARSRRRTPVVEVFEQCRDAVVNINTARIVRMRSLTYPSLFDEIFDFGRPGTRNREVHSIGSGVVIHPSGFIVTNAHVVAQASDVHVAFADQESRPARVIAVDSEHDLAVIKVDAPHPLASINIGRSDDLMIGESVVAIGNPLGLQHTVTTGIVSAINRDQHYRDDVHYTGLIQTDAPINPGNSGGPLININGKLIGINTAIRSDAQNIGFAIPVDQLWELLPSMLDIERRQRVRFGLHVAGPDARVVDIRPDSPASNTGLTLNDRIVGFNGHPVTNAIDYYVQLLGQKPDSTIKLDVKRNDQNLTLAAKLESIPLPDGQALARELLGLNLEEIPPDLRHRYDLPDYIGLIVVGVTRGGPADRVGIQVGDLILRVDRVSVVTLEQLGLSLEQMTTRALVAVEGYRLRADPPFAWTATLRSNPRPTNTTPSPPSRGD